MPKRETIPVKLPVTFLAKMGFRSRQRYVVVYWEPEISATVCYDGVAYRKATDQCEFVRRDVVGRTWPLCWKSITSRWGGLRKRESPTGWSSTSKPMKPCLCLLTRRIKGYHPSGRSLSRSSSDCHLLTSDGVVHKTPVWEDMVRIDVQPHDGERR